ncbi:MAG: hypothetical protein M1813_006703 [Trichoglossum hirsutum]|nr:MAG: hypothetical protein M1813_006703 [Trichoglossum hirsutum]
MSNVSSDLIWEVSRNNNSYLVKRRTGGGVQFSRDPLNLLNKHSRKHSGFVNQQAIGVQPGEKGGVVLTTKKLHSTTSHKPASNLSQNAWGPNKSGRKSYAGIVNHTAKRGYRPDLRHEAVARASAIRQSQLPKKDLPEKKPRGVKAKKAAEGKST